MVLTLSEISGNVCLCSQASNLQNGDWFVFVALSFPRRSYLHSRRNGRAYVPLYWPRHTQRGACPGIHTQPSFLRKTCGLIRTPASTPAPGSPWEEEMEPATWGWGQGAWLLVFHPSRSTVLHKTPGKGNFDRLGYLDLGL